MASKICALFAALVLAGVAMPIAHAQLLASVSVNISGSVPCTTGGSVPVLTTPVFPNAAVVLTVGGNVIANTTTNSNGLFSMVTTLPTSLLASLLSTGRIVVTTPLASCNVTLPSTGALTAPLLTTALNIVAGGLGLTFNLISGIFTLA